MNRYDGKRLAMLSVVDATNCLVRKTRAANPSDTEP